MRPENYLRTQYRDYKVLFIHEVRQDYIDLIRQSPNEKFIVTSKLFYEYMTQRNDIQAELKLYDPSYFVMNKLELYDTQLIINEDDSADSIEAGIIKNRPREIIYFQREICADHHHSELTECEFLCNIYGIKFTRTSQLLEYLLHEK